MDFSQMDMVNCICIGGNKQTYQEERKLSSSQREPPTDPMTSSWQYSRCPLQEQWLRRPKYVVPIWSDQSEFLVIASQEFDVNKHMLFVGYVSVTIPNLMALSLGQIGKGRPTTQSPFSNWEGDGEGGVECRAMGRGVGEDVAEYTSITGIGLRRSTISPVYNHI